MPATTNKLLLVNMIQSQEDLMPIVEASGWYTAIDLFRKTGTSYNTHWNGKYVLDLDEKPWNASDEEIASLGKTKATVVVLFDTNYQISEEIGIYVDSDDSAYCLADDVEDLLS
jgi:hypothetical protein